MNIEETTTEASVVQQLAASAFEPKPVDVGSLYAVADSDGETRIIDTDEYADHPRQKVATRSVTDAASFVAYVNRHADAHTEVFAHTNSSRVVAIIDSHDEAGAPGGWQLHRVSLDLEHSKAWLAWAAADGKLVSQGDFADFLDDRYIDVIDPDPARMIDIATTFQAKTKVDFDSGVRLDSGDVKLTYVEETAAKAGHKGDIEIPKKIQLAMRPYVGGPTYSIWANFRYRLTGGNVLLGFKLERPENVLEAAFADIVTEIRDGRTDKRDGEETVVHKGIGDVPIFAGKPA